MVRNDSYTTSVDALADTSELIADGSGAETGAIEITELGATGDCEVYVEADPAGDSSWATSVQIAGPSDSASLGVTTTGVWHSQGNNLKVSQSQGKRVRIVNVSGGTIDAFMTGFEVDD